MLDTSRASDEVWMVRIPPKLGGVWDDAPAGTVLGELVFRKGGKRNGKTVQKPSLTIRCEESLLSKKKEYGDVPMEYSMEAMTKRVPLLHPFTRKDNEEGTVVVHGTVSRTANLQASRNDSRYRQLCRNRLLQTSVTNNRFVRPVEATELSVRKSLGKNQQEGFGSAVQAFGQRLKEDRENLSAVDNDRKRKYDETPTRSVIFELFSQQRYWTVKHLKEESGKAEKEIRQILHEIGDYHRSGEHKNMWALKTEYQQQDS